MTSGPTEPLFIDINKLAQQRGNSLVNQGQRLFQSFGQGATQLAQTLFPKQERYVGVSDPKNQMTRAVSIPNIDPTGMVGLTEKVGAKAAEPVFKGFTDLSTKLLEKLKGRTTVSRQFIEDLSNSPDLKQAERDLIRRVLGEGDSKSLGSNFDFTAPEVKVGDKVFTKAYHGTGETFDKFELQNSKNLGPNAIFFTPDRGSASYYARGKNPSIKEAFVDTSNLFDFENPQDVSRLWNVLSKKSKDEIMGFETTDFVTLNKIKSDISSGRYDIIEKDAVQEAIRNAGFDGFYIKDYTGPKVFAVYKPEKILSQSTQGKTTGLQRQVGAPEANQSLSNDTISVPDFANRVKSELLPLTSKTKPNGSTDVVIRNGQVRRGFNMYENITLPDELRGPVADYTERIYESPIKTSAGQVHFKGDSMAPNYFAHTRIEDLPATGGKGRIIKPRNMSPEGSAAFDKRAQELASTGDTRRVIEIQSDLFQKGRLDDQAMTREKYEQEELIRLLDERDAIKAKNPNVAEAMSSPEYKEATRKLDEWNARITAKEKAHFAPLEPYRNTWHERVIREEVKQAAKDGKTKLQFPTGETAMKIEGIGQGANSQWYSTRQIGADKYDMTAGTLSPEALKVGEAVSQGGRDLWIITDVLGDGKFKAVPKNRYEYKPDEFYGTKEEHDKMVDAYSETFDISGKVDTENPIYKFYEKQVQKYLTNKYGGKVITDPQGVKWVEIDVKPEFKGLPVEAFGVAGIPFVSQNDEQRRFKSKPVDRTSLFVTTPQR